LTPDDCRPFHFPLFSSHTCIYMCKSKFILSQVTLQAMVLQVSSAAL